MILSIAAVLFTFGLVIFLHEFGHFIVCKLVDIKVERFSFGFGPELAGFSRGETRYSLSAIPLGGYVKPAGENSDEMTGDPREYFSKPWYCRLGVVGAGPAMNYILAFTLFAGVIFMAGEPVPSNEPVIGEVMAGFPAEAAGLKEGDRILSINNTPVETWQQMAELIHRFPEKKIKINYSRREQRFAADVLTIKDSGGKMGLIGIATGVSYRKVGLVNSVNMGLRQCYYWTAYTITTLASKIYHKEKPDLAGPVGIVTMVDKAAHRGLKDLVFLIGLISVAVGIFNLFPIPLLDGGHAVLYIFEGISRRRLTDKVMKAANSAGLVILMGVLLFATYSDIMRIKKSRSSPSEKTGVSAPVPEK